ncbi:hypothetical protein V8C35DRAFT_213407 [Trichoderma chlorosporum]
MLKLGSVISCRLLLYSFGQSRSRTLARACLCNTCSWSIVQRLKSTPWLLGFKTCRMQGCHLPAMLPSNSIAYSTVQGFLTAAARLSRNYYAISCAAIGASTNARPQNPAPSNRAYE